MSELFLVRLKWHRRCKGAVPNNLGLQCFAKFKIRESMKVPLFPFVYLILRQRTWYSGVKYGLVNETQTAAMTGGLVQEFEHSVLPSIKPLVTLVATALSILVRTCFCSLLQDCQCTWKTENFQLNYSRQGKHNCLYLLCDPQPNEFFQKQFERSISWIPQGIYN